MMTDSTLHTERQRRLRKWGGMFQNKVSFYCFMLFFGLEAGAVRQIRRWRRMEEEGEGKLDEESVSKCKGGA